MKTLLKNTLVSVVLGLSTLINAYGAEAPLNGMGSSLTLYVYPPRDPIDWTSPESALKTMINNLVGVALTSNALISFVNDLGEDGTLSSTYKSSMGHTIAHIQCTLPGGELYDHWASFSGQDYREVDKQLLFKEKVGLGAFFHNYIDGHIIMGIENVKRITHYKGSKQNGQRQRPRYIQYELDAARCQKAQRMVSFFEGFHFPHGTPLAQLKQRAEKDTLYFTSIIDPYASYLERIRTGKGLVGGGCAPFGAALVKVTGRYKPELDKLWTIPVTISEKLIGGQFDPRYKNDPVYKNDPRLWQKVSLGDILHGEIGKKWTYEEEGYTNRFVSQYDPQKIWDFTGDIIDCLSMRVCKSGAGDVFGNEMGRMGLGETQVFRDTVEKRNTNSENPGPGEVTTETVEQPVAGIVWRLK